MTLLEPIPSIRLKNGLEIKLKEIHTAPLISSWVWYRVGSRDEIPGITGISHWVEHMQFKGTEKYPAEVREKNIARAGGTWNAFTYLDWTTYFETMPADKIDQALEIEADRMVNSIYDPEEVESERTVIMSERQGRENSPSFWLNEAIHKAAFQIHSYSHMILGDMVDLGTIQREDLYQHYKTYYAPSNAVISIAGDFETESMLKRLKTLYKDLPEGADPPRVNRPEPTQRGEHRLTVEGPGDTVMVDVAYHAPPASHEDFFPLLILDSILSGPQGLNMFGGGGISNKTSRLYAKLVEEDEVAVSISGGIPATIDPYLYSINMIVHPASTPEAALQSLDGEIQRLQDSPPNKEELARAVRQNRALFAYGGESITNQAFWMGFSEMFASYDWVTGYLGNLKAVTPGDVQRIAQKYLLPKNRIVGIYLPHNKGNNHS
ncbi:MAG TPA: insulinase family protein [Chloroflexi bacterium]|nr:MAG: insulinase family protein [Chloroflexota bacterium]HDD56185.1 insulinase family protein [Chloroflexota bacterium]